jgi:hypothetical protein
MRVTTKQSNGTSSHGTTIRTSVEKLKAVLGVPEYEGNYGDDKVNFEWTMETDNGDVFTVYDWKEYRSINPTETIEWHIGGANETITNQAAMEIKAVLNK